MRDKELLGEARLLGILSHSPAGATTTTPPGLAFPIPLPLSRSLTLNHHQADKGGQDDRVLGRVIDHTLIQS